jgi:hypothetical protein
MGWTHNTHVEGKCVYAIPVEKSVEMPTHRREDNIKGDL